MIDPSFPSTEPKSIVQRIARSLSHAWDWLTVPAATIQDRERRQQAWLLSSLLLALILAITLILVMRTIGGVLWHDFTTLAAVGAIATLIVIYSLSRTQHYIASATLTVAALFALIHTAPLWADRVDQALFYATLPILLSSMLLSLPAMLGVAVISIGNILLLVLFSLRGIDLYLAPLSHTLITTAIIVTFIHHRDRLERERQAALRASESNYRLLLEQASDGIFITDPQGNYLLVNSQGREMLGASTGELLRLNIKDIILSEDLTSNLLRFDELSIGKTVIAECRLRGKNDRLIPVEVSLKRLADGRLQAIIRDITERKRAEEVLRDQEERYRVITELMSDYAFAFRVEPDGTFTEEWDTVDSFKRITGYATEELGTTFILYHPEDQERAYCDVTAVIAGKPGNGEYRIITKSGDLRWMQIYRRPVWDPQQNRVVRFYGVAKDITERKQAEVALQASLHEMETAYQQAILYAQDLGIEMIKNKQAEEIRAELEQQLRQSQKIEAVGRLASGVAHDFNNLLTAIMGYTGLALAALPSNHPVRSDIQGIQKTAQRASHLVRQLLAFARQQVSAPRVLNLNDLILDLDTMLRQLIRENIELMLLLGPDLGSLKADPSQLEQLLVNLAVNARDAMPEGGILTIETTNVTLDEYDTRRHVEVTPGEYILLAVSDTGSGMTEEVKAHLFEPFFTTKEVGKGTGLGLAICFGIVEQSGGHIEVDSQLSQGTIFKIYWPRVAEVANSLSKRDASDDRSWRT